MNSTAAIPLNVLLTKYICIELQKKRSRKRKSSEYEEDEDIAKPVPKTADRSKTSRRSTTPLHDRPNDSRLTRTPQTARAEENGNSKRTSQPVDKSNGFDRDMTPDRVLGASDVTGELVFLIKFKDQDGAEMIPARIANVKCPQLVIQFYEERLMWHSDNEDDGDDMVTDAMAESEAAKATIKRQNGSVEDAAISDESS